MNSRVPVVVFGLALMVAAGCATGRAISNANTAALKGDWDSAVAFYREALDNDPDRVDIKVRLERAMRNASAEHMKRARELEAQDQLPGAIAEYRLASSLDPGNTMASTKASELERKIRAQLEASRPPPRIDQLRQQAALAQGLPKLDPRTPITSIRHQGSIRDLLRLISDMTGIGVTYEQTTQAAGRSSVPVRDPERVGRGSARADHVGQPADLQSHRAEHDLRVRGHAAAPAALRGPVRPAVHVVACGCVGSLGHPQPAAVAGRDREPPADSGQQERQHAHHQGHDAGAAGDRQHHPDGGQAPRRGDDRSRDPRGESQIPAAGRPGSQPVGPRVHVFARARADGRCTVAAGLAAARST